MTRQERLELNALSKEVYGVESRWHTLLTKGTKKVIYSDKVGKRNRRSSLTEIKYSELPQIKAKMLELKAAKDASKQS